MARTRITELPESNKIQPEDLLTAVSSSATSPLSTKITVKMLSDSLTTVSSSISASYSLSSSYAFTASYAANGGVTSFNTRTGPVNLLETDISGLGAGIVSSSTFSQAAQGVLTATINGNSQNVDLGLETTDNVQFNNITGSNALFSGTITAQTLKITTISSSVIYSSGSNIFGDELTDTQQFTGSVSVLGTFSVNGTSTFNGRVTANNLTGSLFGTSSWAEKVASAGIVGDITLGTQTTGQYASTIAGGAGLSATAANPNDGTAYTIDAVAGAAISLTSPTSDAINVVAGSGISTSAPTSNAVNIDTGSAHFTGGVKNKMDTDGVVSSSAQVVLENANKTGFSGANTITTLGTVTTGDVKAILPSGVVSASTFSSPSQGTLRATINGVITDVDLGVQTTDNVQFGQVTGSSALFTGQVTTNVDASINNVNVGKGAGNIASNLSVGTGSLSNNTSGYNNTAIGTFALRENTVGYSNTAVGAAALSVNGSGIFNAAFGTRALESNTNGSNNVALGIQSLNSNTLGNYNIGLGFQAGKEITTGNYNVYLGGYTGSLAEATQNNNVFISDGAGNIKLFITGSNNLATFYGTGGVSASAFTGSLLGTASYVVTASYVTGSSVFGPYGSNSVISSSYAATASYALNSSALVGGADRVAFFNNNSFLSSSEYLTFSTSSQTFSTYYLSVSNSFSYQSIIRQKGFNSSVKGADINFDLEKDYSIGTFQTVLSLSYRSGSYGVITIDPGPNNPFTYKRNATGTYNYFLTPANYNSSYSYIGTYGNTFTTQNYESAGTGFKLNNPQSISQDGSMSFLIGVGVNSNPSTNVEVMTLTKNALSITGSVSSTVGFTGSLYGTASWALNGGGGSVTPAGINGSVQFNSASVLHGIDRFRIYNYDTAPVLFLSGSTNSSILLQSNAATVSQVAGTLQFNGANDRILGFIQSYINNEEGYLGINTAPSGSGAAGAGIQNAFGPDSLLLSTKYTDGRNFKIYTAGSNGFEIYTLSLGRPISILQGTTYLISSSISLGGTSPRIATTNTEDSMVTISSYASSSASTNKGNNITGIIRFLTPTTSQINHIKLVTIPSGSSTESTVFAITDSGSVAINKSAPTAPLDVNGNALITGSLVVSGSNGAGVFSQGATLADYGSGISNSGSYMVWRAPFPCYVVKVYGYREGGGNAEINAVRSGSGGQSFHTGSNLVLSSANVWTSTNTVENTDYSIGDSLKIIVSGSGGNNQVAVQVDFLKKF